MSKQLIDQIKKLANTQVQESRTAEGLGSIVIYQTVPNGVKATSVWLGRPFTEKRLQEYLASCIS